MKLSADKYITCNMPKCVILNSMPPGCTDFTFNEEPGANCSDLDPALDMDNVKLCNMQNNLNLSTTDSAIAECFS